MTDPRTFTRLVDDVAREMTASDPAPGFRARVIARASAVVTAPRAWWRAPLRLAMAGAAVVVAFAGLVVVRGPQKVAAPLAVIAASDGTSPVRGTGQETGAAWETGGSSPRRVAPRLEAAMLPASVLEWRARVIPELTAVAPLAFDEIQPVWLSIPQLGVTPLGILPITVAPIGGEGGGRW